MDNYVGKHLLIDCYGCDDESVSSAEELTDIITHAAEHVGLDIKDTFLYEDDDEFTVAVYGEKSHICIHAYPTMNYVAMDIYSFYTDITPSLAMRVIQDTMHPEKIRATSVKRGNLDAHPDMRPRTKSKTTAMRKFKNTGRQINAAGKKMIHFFRRNRKNGSTD